MEIRQLPIESLKPYESNPRVIPDEAVEAVARSIEQFGFRVPIITDEDMVIIAGHTRLLTAGGCGRTFRQARGKQRAGRVSRRRIQAGGSKRE